MYKRLFSIVLAAALAFSLLAGCASAPASTPAQQDSVEPMNLEELYNQGMEVLAQLGSDAPILFPETNIDYLNEFYHGLADIELKQFYAGVAPVTNAPFEIKFFGNAE